MFDTMYRNFNNLQLLREVTKTSLLHQLPATAIIIQEKEEGTLGVKTVQRALH